MEMKQILVLIGNEPERLRKMLEVIESKQIKVNAIFEGYEAFFGLVHIILPEPDEAIQALLEAGFAIFSTDRNKSPVFKYHNPEGMAVPA